MCSSTWSDVRLDTRRCRGELANWVDLRLLVAVADHSIEKAVWSAHWVFVTFLLSIINLLVQVCAGLFVGRVIFGVKVSCTR